VQWEVQKNLHIQYVALLRSNDHGYSWTVLANHQANTGSYVWAVPNGLADSVKVAVVQVETENPADSTVSGVLAVSDFFRISTATGVDDMPVRLELRPVWPTPSTGQAVVRFGLPMRANVDLDVFDVLGRRVVALAHGEQLPGWHDVTWDGRMDSGGHAATGLYFVRMRVEGQRFQQRILWPSDARTRGSAQDRGAEHRAAPSRDRAHAERAALVRP
jgi:hypothetical protein